MTPATFDMQCEENLSKNSSMCTGRRVACVLITLLVITISVVGCLLLAAFIRALTLQVPEYFDQAMLQQIRQLPNMTSSNFKQLPTILGATITFPTISNAAGSSDSVAFQGLHSYLKQIFTNVFNSNIVIIEQNFPSLMLTVQGQEGHNDGSFLLLAHLDVVPVETQLWEGEPFQGNWMQSDEDGGYVNGRGAIDDKLGAVAILCALDELLDSGWVPKNTFYIAFGHDEEVGGADGAARMAALLQTRGISNLSFILDEGMPILDGVIPGLDVPVAVIGVTEKGSLTVRVSTTGPAGHSSFPPPYQASHRLVSALQRLQAAPHPLMLGAGPEGELLQSIAPRCSWPTRYFLSNLWLFRPLVGMAMARDHMTNALQRTTTAITVIRVGDKENVVPGTAWALVNHRVHPAQTLQEVLDHNKRAFVDQAVKVTVVEGHEPHPISPYGLAVPPFRFIATMLHHLYPTAVVTPGALIANTDTRHYLPLSRHVYRFMPYLLGKEDLAGIHGHNERVSAANVWRAARFYQGIMWGAGGGFGDVKGSGGLRTSGEL